MNYGLKALQSGLRVVLTDIQAGNPVTPALVTQRGLNDSRAGVRDTNHGPGYCGAGGIRDRIQDGRGRGLSGEVYSPRRQATSPTRDKEKQCGFLNWLAFEISPLLRRQALTFVIRCQSFSCFSERGLKPVITFGASGFYP